MRCGNCNSDSYIIETDEEVEQEARHSAEHVAHVIKSERARIASFIEANRRCLTAPIGPLFGAGWAAACDWIVRSIREGK